MVTVTSTGPRLIDAGTVTVMLLALWTVTEVAGVSPKVTVVSWVKPEPVIVTIVPPVAGPEFGSMPVISETLMAEKLSSRGPSKGVLLSGEKQ